MGVKSSMALKLMYITNNPEVALIAEDAGVDRIFVDMEYIGKAERQGGMDTVQSYHTVQDVERIRRVIRKAALMVRVNPIHEAMESCSSSEEEINAVIEAGADIVMLPFFKTVEEVRRFIRVVNGRVRTFLLVETPEAAEAIEEILAVPGVDEIHIGLNDLSLGYGYRFMFEPLANGMVEALAEKIKAAGKPYGFGGIASLGKGMLPSEYVIREHYRLDSTTAILSRSFCNVNKIDDLTKVKSIFEKGVREIRNLEEECQAQIPGSAYFTDNKRLVEKKVKEISDSLPERKPK